MKFNVAQLGRQLLEIWKQLGLNQRLSVVFAGLAVVVGLLSLAYFSSRVDYALLYAKMDNESAAKVLAALQNQKVLHKSGPNNSVYVPADQVDRLRIQLAPDVRHGEVGFEIFDKANFGISDFAQRVNFLRATKGELERTISHLDDVETANVTLNLPENRLLVDNKRPATAAVLVKLKGNAQLNPGTVKTIQHLVASAVEGLQPAQISVADTHGTNFAEPSDNDSFAGSSSTQLAARRSTEQYLSKKAEGMLDQVLGPGQSVVRVSADPDIETQTTTKEEYGEAVPRSKKVKKDTNNSTTTSPGAVGGVGANTGGETNNPAPTTPATVSQQNTTDEIIEYDVAKTTSNLVKGAGGFKRLSAAVFIAAKMEGAGKDRKAAPRSTEEMEKLRRIVQSALGIQPNAERKDEITLEEISFNDQVATDLTQKMDKQERQEFWIGLVRQLIFPVLGVFVLATFWRAFTRTPAENIPIGIPIGTLAAEGGANGNGNGNGGPPDWRKSPPPGVVTVEVLNQLVRDNPGNMTQAIRSWLTRGNKQN